MQQNWAAGSRKCLILNRENLGFAAANNQGLAVARGRYVLLLNSDTEQTENAIGRAVKFMDAHPQVGILGVMHRNGDSGRTFQQSAAPFPTPMGGCRRLLVGIFERPLSLAPTEPPPEQDVDWVTGSFLLARRACLDQVGPLDERFFVYAEDIDLCYQARKAGWQVRFWPGVSIVHMGSSSADQVADKTFMLYRNELEFFRKNQPRLATFAFYGAVMTARLGFSTIYQTSWQVGRGPSSIGGRPGAVASDVEFHDPPIRPKRAISVMIGLCGHSPWEHEAGNVFESTGDPKL